MARCTLCIKFDECPWRTEPDSLCSAYQPKPQTNADHIRSMTDEELAKMLDGSICPPGYNQIGACEAGEEECYLCWLDWLRQGVE